jgi:hypothetical protein
MEQFPTRARFNVVATFAGMESARAAIERLERGGIESQQISLSGPAMDEAESRTGFATAREEDVRAGTYVGKRVFLGVVLGAITGAALGAAIALGAGMRTGVLATAMIAGALALGAVGGMLGGVAGLPMTADWARTFRDAGAQEVVVTVRAEDRKHFEKASDVLAAHHAEMIQRYVRRGGRWRAA